MPYTRRRVHASGLSLIDHACGSRSTGGRTALRSRLRRAANIVNTIASVIRHKGTTVWSLPPGCLRLRGHREDGRQERGAQRDVPDGGQLPALAEDTPRRRAADRL